MPELGVCAPDSAVSPVAEAVCEVVRREIASDLHDTVLQPLTALVAQLECLQRQQFDQARLSAALASCLSLSREAISSIRLAVMGGQRIHPHALKGLSRAIREHIRPQLQETGLAVRLDVAQWPGDVPAEITSALYLAVREAVINAWKHAHASEVWVRLDCHSAVLRVRVRDDGRGYGGLVDTPDSAYRRGWGLTGMEQRLRALGGELVVMSAPGAGVVLAVRVPLRRRESWVAGIDGATSAWARGTPAN